SGRTRLRLAAGAAGWLADSTYPALSSLSFVSANAASQALARAQIACTLLTFGQCTRFRPVTPRHSRVTISIYADVCRAATARSGQGGPGRLPRATPGGWTWLALDRARSVACDP